MTPMHTQRTLFNIALTFTVILLTACGTDINTSSRVKKTQQIYGTNDFDRLTLNDTGVTQFMESQSYPIRALSNKIQPVPSMLSSSPSGFPGQDAAFGLDKQASVSDVDGKAGFQYVKLGADGQPVADQAIDYALKPWSCVYDQITGLTWEVKTRSGLQGTIYTYTWFNPNPLTNGGNAGDAHGTENCGDTLPNCNSKAYVDAINAMALCGYSDWRLPLREELRTLIDYGVVIDRPMIDTQFFPNTQAVDHWTSQTAVYRDDKVVGDSAWEVHFDKGYSESHGKNRTAVAVRVVRGPR